MSLYRRISIRVWGDEKFTQLSAPKPNARYLFLHLLTGPHTGQIPGLSVAGEAALSEALVWPRSAFRRCFAELETAKMAQADWRARLVWLPNAVRHNPPSNVDIVIGWRSAFEDIPECRLKWIAWDHIAAWLAENKPKFSDPFSDHRDGHGVEHGEGHGVRDRVGHGRVHSSGSGSGSGNQTRTAGGFTVEDSAGGVAGGPGRPDGPPAAPAAGVVEAQETAGSIRGRAVDGAPETAGEVARRAVLRLQAAALLRAEGGGS